MGYVDRGLKGGRITLLSFSYHRHIPFIHNKFEDAESRTGAPTKVRR